jgi:protein-tyrosine phosphatase
MFGPARAELARRGYDGPAHRARQIQPSWLPGCDLLIGMDRANVADLGRMAPDAETAGRIRLLRTFDPALRPDDPYGGDVPDPFGGPPDGYALAFDLVLAATRGLAGQLAELPDVPAHGRT